jgi:hypothetical protein
MHWKMKIRQKDDFLLSGFSPRYSTSHPACKFVSVILRLGLDRTKALKHQQVSNTLIGSLLDKMLDIFLQLSPSLPKSMKKITINIVLSLLSFHDAKKTTTNDVFVPNDFTYNISFKCASLQTLISIPLFDLIIQI